tara:strand:+ start:208 stop:456 length:249 start_codon:yes stop_codon:yes gene_type:complete
MDLEIEIENEKIGRYSLSGEIYFRMGSLEDYSEDELIEYELYDSKTDLLFEETSEEIERLILKTAIKIYKRDYLDDEESEEW